MPETSHDPPSFIRRHAGVIGVCLVFFGTLFSFLIVWGWAVTQRMADVAFLKKHGFTVQFSERPSPEGAVLERIQRVIVSGHPNGAVRIISNIIPPKLPASEFWPRILRQRSLDEVYVTLDVDDSVMTNLAQLPKLRNVMLNGRSTATDAWIEQLPDECKWQSISLSSPLTTAKGVNQFLDKCRTLIGLSIPIHACDEVVYQRLANQPSPYSVALVVFEEYPLSNEQSRLLSSLEYPRDLSIVGEPNNQGKRPSFRTSGTSAAKLLYDNFDKLTLEGYSSASTRISITNVKTTDCRGIDVCGITTGNVESLSIKDSRQLEFVGALLSNEAASLEITNCGSLKRIVLRTRSYEPREVSLSDVPNVESLEVDALTEADAPWLSELKSLQRLSLNQLERVERGALSMLNSHEKLEALECDAFDAVPDFIQDEIQHLPNLKFVEFQFLDMPTLSDGSRARTQDEKITDYRRRLQPFFDRYPHIEFVIKQASHRD